MVHATNAQVQKLLILKRTDVCTTVHPISKHQLMDTVHVLQVSALRETINFCQTINVLHVKLIHTCQQMEEIVWEEYVDLHYICSLMVHVHHAMPMNFIAHSNQDVSLKCVQQDGLLKEMVHARNVEITSMFQEIEETARNVFADLGINALLMVAHHHALLTVTAQITAKGASKRNVEQMKFLKLMELAPNVDLIKHWIEAELNVFTKLAHLDLFFKQMVLVSDVKITTMSYIKEVSKLWMDKDLEEIA